MATIFLEHSLFLTPFLFCRYMKIITLIQARTFKMLPMNVRGANSFSLHNWFLYPFLYFLFPWVLSIFSLPSFWDKKNSVATLLYLRACDAFSGHISASFNLILCYFWWGFNDIFWLIFFALIPNFFLDHFLKLLDHEDYPKIFLSFLLEVFDLASFFSFDFAKGLWLPRPWLLKNNCHTLWILPGSSPLQVVCEEYHMVNLLNFKISFI